MPGHRRGSFPPYGVVGELLAAEIVQPGRFGIVFQVGGQLGQLFQQLPLRLFLVESLRQCPDRGVLIFFLERQRRHDQRGVRFLRLDFQRRNRQLASFVHGVPQHE